MSDRHSDGSTIITKPAGSPLGGVIELGETDNGHAMVMYSRPDFVIAPAGLEAHGVTAGARVEVDNIEQFVGRCPVPACCRENVVIRLWDVHYRGGPERNARKFLILETLECCKQYCWAVAP